MDNDEDCGLIMTRKSPVSTGGWTFSTRLLGILTLIFLLSCRILLMNQCSIARELKASSSGNPLITQWKVSTKKSPVAIKSSPIKNSRVFSKAYPGEIVEAYGDGTPDYIFLLEPQRGFSIRKGETTGRDRFEKVYDEEYSEPVSSTCPLLYSGWWPEDAKPQRFLYAPLTIVVAQQLWNALQVFEILLIISLVYSYSKSSLNFYIACVMSLVAILLLPFSHYLTSPGGSFFSLVTLVTCVWAIVGNAMMTISIGDKCTIPGHRSIVREEVVAFICNLCCSLYNHHASRYTWPHWNHHFHSIDTLLGWDDGTPGTMSFYTMGMSGVRSPMYVARNGATTFGASTFVVIWSFLPIIYIFYFGCLYILSSRSPYKNIQRAMCIFCIFHFMFLTDVVAYAYGRGFWTPHAEIFHWSERWAWRVAILLPIYQNCTNGHWIKGHRNHVVGKLVHYFMGVWGFLFFLQQVLLSDTIKTVQYLYGWKYRSFIQILGLPSSKMFSYHGALVVMTIMYGIMIVGGFSHYKVFVGRK